MSESGEGEVVKPVEVVPYDDRWPELFSTERKRLKEIMGEAAHEVHHIGSTSVPGLSAKPVIDCLVVAPDLRRVDDLTPRLRMHGLVARGEYGIPGRRYFVGHAASGHRLHVHVFSRGHERVGRHLRFRDYLRAHEPEARRYEEEKRRLATEFAADREAYQKGKATLIEDLCVRAGAWESREASRVAVRRAELRDATELARLRWEFRPEDQPDQGLHEFSREFERWWAEALASDWMAAVADEGRGGLVGCVFLRSVSKVPNPGARDRAWGYVTNSYVAPSHRGRGVGSRLLELVVAAARERGHEFLIVWPSEEAASFYIRAGFREVADVHGGPDDYPPLELILS